MISIGESGGGEATKELTVQVTPSGHVSVFVDGEMLVSSHTAKSNLPEPHTTLTYDLAATQSSPAVSGEAKPLVEELRRLAAVVEIADKKPEAIDLRGAAEDIHGVATMLAQLLQVGDTAKEDSTDSGLGRGVQPASGKSEGGGEADGPITWREFENDPQSGEEGPWFILCMNGEPWMQVDSYFGTEYLPDWISDYDGDEAQARNKLEHRMRRRCKLANAAIASAADPNPDGGTEG